MITFNYETKFELSNEKYLKKWVSKCINIYNFEEGELNYIFCDDEYLHKLNVEFLKHDTLTDIISFDYTLGKVVSGDIFISIERIKENHLRFNQTFDNEINRVMIHGVLHFMGMKDKSEVEKVSMRSNEDSCLRLLIN